METKLSPQKPFTAPFLSGLAIFGILFCLSPGWLLSDDASARLVIARQLWKFGTPFLPLENIRPERFLATPYGLTTYFGIGQSILFIPFDLLGVWLSGKIPSDPALSGHIQIFPLTLLYLPLMGLLWWHAMVRWLKTNGFSETRSLRTATIFFLTSISLPYAAQSLQEESVIGLLLLHFMTEFRLAIDQGKRIHFLFAGFFFALCLLFRTNSIFALFIGTAILFDRRQMMKPLPDNKWQWNNFGFSGLGAAPPLVILLIFNFWRFENPFLFGHQLHYQELIKQHIEPWRSVNWEIALNLLFGLGKGVLVSSPLLILACAVFTKRAWRRQLTLTIPFAILIGSTLFYSKLNGFACGGYAWGARFQVHLLSLMVLPVALVWDEVPKRALTLLVVLGLAIQTLAVLAPESLEYHQEMARYGDYNEALIVSPTQGQLPMRFRNVFNWIAGKPLDQEASYPVQLGPYRKYFFPNLWPFQISRLWPEKAGTFTALWIWILASSALLLYKALLTQSEPSRPKIRKVSVLLDT